MSRFAGRNGRVYLGIASSSATAEPLPFVASWGIKFPNEKIDVTAMGDNRKTYVAGLADQSGEFGGWMDDATSQTYTAAIDGQARKFYLYPNLTDATKYFWGTIVVDAEFSSKVDGAAEMSASWTAATDITRVGV
jgi:hypothetical protein